MNPTKPARFQHRLGANQPAASPTARRLAEMAQAILSDTDGEYRLEMFPESRLGPDPQMFADLRAGKLEFYLSGALLGGVAPTSALPLMPFVFHNSAAVFAALDGALGDRIRGELAGSGLHAFRRSWQNGFHHITNDVRPIETAADFAGLKIRTPGGDIAADFFRTLGGFRQHCDAISQNFREAANDRQRAFASALPLVGQFADAELGDQRRVTW